MDAPDSIPDYLPTTVSGSSWQRAKSVCIDNPSEGMPSLNILEERVILLSDGRKIYEPVGSLTAEFDPTNPLHGQIYMLLNDLYIALREVRDNPPPEEVLV
jgi:hypothetical protein